MGRDKAEKNGGRKGENNVEKKPKLPGQGERVKGGDLFKDLKEE